MLLVDDRVGSKDLLKPLRDAGLPAEIARLEFGDVTFQGKGPGGSSLDIAVELKTLSDLVGSLRSGRLAGHQLPGLSQQYDYTWLVVEGMWRHDEAGQVITYRGKYRGWVPVPGRMSAGELEKQVLTLENCGGLHVRYTNSRRDTVRFLSNLYRWWTDVAVDQHTSHLAVHTAPTIVPVSDFRQAVMRWPNIGLKTSKAVEREFGRSIRKACLASIERWAGIETITDKGQARRLGQKAATEIVRFLEGGD